MSDGGAESLPKEMALAVDNLKLQEPAPPPPQTDNKTKIDILLKATGNAPIMKAKKWSVDPEKTVGWIMDFLTKYFKLKSEERIFLYVNQTFAPAPDQLVRNLFNCFGSDGKLVLHYCTTHAWG